MYNQQMSNVTMYNQKMEMSRIIKTYGYPINGSYSL